MSNKYKCVQINLEESLYDFLKKYIDSYIPDTDMSYYLKCLAINRLMDLGLLNECGMPNEFVFGPTLDFSTIETTNNFGIPAEALRDMSFGVSK